MLTRCLGSTMPATLRPPWLVQRQVAGVVEEQAGQVGADVCSTRGRRRGVWSQRARVGAEMVLPRFARPDCSAPKFSRPELPKPPALKPELPAPGVPGARHVAGARSAKAVMHGRRRCGKREADDGPVVELPKRVPPMLMPMGIGPKRRCQPCADGFAE